MNTPSGTGDGGIVKAVNTKFNKASIAALAGSIVTILAVMFEWGPEIQGAVATIFTTLGVWLIPNASQ